MDPSIVVAIITGIVSISAAVIQAVSAIQESQGVERNSIPKLNLPTTTRSQTVTETHSRAWWWMIGILVSTNFLWIIALEYDAPNVIHFGAIPWCTCLLAYFRPIRWGYVAGIVTLVSFIAVFSFLLLGGDYSDSEVSQLVLLFVANSVLAAGIAYFRQSQIRRSVISNTANSHQATKSDWKLLITATSQLTKRAPDRWDSPR